MGDDGFEIASVRDSLGVTWSRVDQLQVAAALALRKMAAELRFEAERNAKTSRDFGRGMAWAATIVASRADDAESGHVGMTDAYFAASREPTPAGRALAIHYPADNGEGPSTCAVCYFWPGRGYSHIVAEAWPCPTVRALMGEPRAD